MGHYNCNRATEAINLKKKTLSLMVIRRGGQSAAHWLKPRPRRAAVTSAAVAGHCAEMRPHQRASHPCVGQPWPQRGPAKEGQPGREETLSRRSGGLEEGTETASFSSSTLQGLAPPSRTRGHGCKQVHALLPASLLHSKGSKYFTEGK